MTLETKIKELKDFVHDKLGYTITNMNESFNKTGTDGIDAETFFMVFGDNFQIDMNTFDYGRYFSGENPFSNIINNFFKFKGKPRDFTFNHLLYVIHIKKWVDPECVDL
ncbi:DUF1493 family protein [Tenacibaculum tangerinum]|uniref:DUF1493 family protein n=1 Tax=Tenacibaculum tangerinum TaxID=3038772 RepID=A0ABY8L3U0_9FLAO|nr:DUF1493 family protein [Tenacibaculum tangerinum]WGH75936.1 DUF1493 family protein [Tenacibaculum tangerinum]